MKPILAPISTHGRNWRYIESHGADEDAVANREPVLASLQALRLADLVLLGACAGQRASKLVAQTEPRSEQSRIILERANEA